MKLTLVRNVKKFFYRTSYRTFKKEILKYKKEIMNLGYIFGVFIDYIFGPFVVLVGLIGNLSGLIVLYKSDLQKHLGPILIYKSLLILNSLKLMEIFIIYLQNFQLNLLVLNIFLCKLLTYAELITSSYMPCHLIYISLDRYISTRFESKTKLLKKNSTQVIFLGVIALSSFTIFAPTLVHSTIQKINNSLQVCGINHLKFIFIYNNLVNTFLYSTMVILTLLLIKSICFLKLKIRTQANHEVIRELKKELELTIMVFLLNFFYFLFCLPVNFSIIFIESSFNLFLLAYYFYYLDYAFFFYFILIVDHKFRKHFKCLFKKQTFVRN